MSRPNWREVDAHRPQAMTSHEEWTPMKRLVALSTLALGTAFAAQPALAAPAAAATSPGQVIALANTSQLFITDDQGAAHFAGDTRALAGRPINWGARSEVSVAALRGMPRSDPWLTAGLVKVGDAIYLPEWDGAAAVPTLRHVQSPDDLALLGINGANYYRLVLDQAAWEREYGLQGARLPPPAPAPPPPPPAAAALSAAPPAPAPAGTGLDTGRRAAAHFAWALWAIGTALCVLGPLTWALSGFAHVDGNVLYRAGLPLGVVYGVVFVAVATQGALIAARWPHNPIGWMGCAAAILVGLLVFGGGFYAY